MAQKVIIIGPAHPLRGGLSSFNERLAREFVSQHFETEIYTFSLQYPAFLFPGTTQYSSEPAPADLIIHEKINSISPLNWLSVGYELCKKKPDIIVVRYWLPFMGPCLGSILRMVKRNKHTRIICIADNIVPHEKRFGDAAFTRYFIKPIDAFITMSEKVLADLHSISDKPARQIVHPLYDNFGEALSIEAAREHLNIAADKKIVLFFGFIRKYKGLDLLFEAISLLKQQNFFADNHVQFLIAGEFYENAQPYLDAIQNSGIEELIILKNEFIADSEVKYYLSAADCVIQPYKSATQSGVTPLAYHFEKPMLVTNVGGLPSLVPATVGMICEPNAAAIAAQIEAFFNLDPAHFIQHIKEEKKKYSWQHLTDAIVSLCELK
jgi:glycosyltransferase involved in cell wall biosynthesis